MKIPPRVILLLITFFVLVLPCSALDFSLRPKVFVFIPLGEGNTAPDGNAIYKPGGGGELGFEIDLSTVWPNPLGLGYTAGIEGAMQFNALRNDAGGNVSFYSFGGALGLYYFPLPRLFTRIDGALGVYASARDEGKSDPGLFLRVGAEAGFRFTPAFTLGLNGGWRHFSGGGEVYNSGMYIGLTAQISFRTAQGSAVEGISAELEQTDPVYPVFMQLYQEYPLGSVLLRNNENAEIRDVRLSFRASPYTASEFACGSVPLIPRGRSAEFPLLADFSPDILLFTDTGRIIGEVVIRYRLLGQERETVRAVTVASHSRNIVPPGDAAGFAAFVSPTAPETLDFARFIAGLSRSSRRTGHNQNMQYAIWLLEGLRASNIRLGETYTDGSETQFPAETLSYRTGGSRDLALLFASGLEGVGIKSAFIQTEDDFLVAFSLEAGQAAAETLFANKDNILIIGDEVWLPLSMGAFNGGFSAAWKEGAAILTQTFDGGKQADFVVVEDAWAVYPPAPLPALGRDLIRTDTDAAAREVNRVMRDYIEQELVPLIGQVQGQISTKPTAALYNRLGILQTRAGSIAEARAAYERAAGMGSVPAMANRGNLALTEGDYRTAERWYRQALEKDSQNRAALRGMEQIQEKK